MVIQKSRIYINYTVGVVYGLFWLFTAGSLIGGNSKIIVENLPIVISILGALSIIMVASNFKSFINQFKTFKITDSLILIIATGLLLITAFMWQDNYFGIITTITGIICVVQAARGNIWTYFWGAINTLMYAVVAYYSDYAGDFVLNIAYYVPMQFIGVYTWMRHYNNSEDVVQVRVFNVKNWIQLAVGLGVGTFLVAVLMPQINALLGMDSNPLPIVDSLTTTGSIVAQILMAKRFREQWALWIGINVLSIIMWAVKGDMTMVIMWTAYLVNSVFGYYEWTKLNKSQSK